ncbi:5-oxoprolinase subunit PxpB [Bacillus sp. H-16]|uniref:5-oxoprolinase subunit PxpB n=1 Tax=Alteribacter salitolerans TaxID=2912333 RepID=UPI001964EBAB|nr:5-oxoprolinase subunit PxpB [Alteribacter salitolerans]MBM7095479.1 5-oxoprolinase subunit PxpB [Alteribacter salitolerans]
MIQSIKPAGDRAVRIGFKEEISDTVHQHIRSFCAVLEEENHSAIAEWVPAYTSVTVFYKPELVKYDEIALWLNGLSERAGTSVSRPVRVISVPVLYGGEKGPDLSRLAARHQLEEEEVIRLHTEPDYLVYMLGFAPGFPYLGGLSDRLHTPRLDKPRQKVSAGSVGIAGEQTGIYPLDSPGGWQLIGHTPARLFDPDKEDPFLFRAGDRLRFFAVEKEEYEELLARAEDGKSVVKIETEEADANEHAN